MLDNDPFDDYIHKNCKHSYLFYLSSPLLSFHVSLLPDSFSDLMVCIVFSSVNYFSCVALILATRQISTHFSNLKSDYRRSLALTESFFIPHTILSPINPSFKSANSHLEALFHNSVTYASIVSLSC